MTWRGNTPARGSTSSKPSFNFLVVEGPSPMRQLHSADGAWSMDSLLRADRKDLPTAEERAVAEESWEAYLRSKDADRELEDGTLGFFPTGRRSP